VADQQGQNPVQLTDLRAPLTASPRWAPDGREIAFDSHSAGNADIYVVGANGGPPRRITTEPSEDVLPTWSRDGRWLFFASNRDGTTEIWRVPSAGGPALKVTQHGGFRPLESPDGRFLYYAKSGQGLWRIPLEGGLEELVTPELSGSDWGFYAVAERGIYYLRRDHREIRYYDLATRLARTILEMDRPAPTHRGHGMAVSPDHRWLLFSQADGFSSDLKLVDSFR
jgi:Tol biopolymer transport system component